MAEGYRIIQTNQELWGHTVLVKHPGNPTANRAPKDYVFRLDADGSIIVSGTIWERLQEIKRMGLEHGFVLSNVVANPPTQSPMSDDSDLTRRVFRQDQNGISETERAALRSIVPKGFHAKGSQIQRRR